MESLEAIDSHVANDLVGNSHISTVFLGVDYSYAGGQPFLYETMVFGGPFNGKQIYYRTWEEAERGHKEMVEKVKAVVN